MAYSLGRATEIAWIAKHIGIEATALQEGISEESVKRAIRYVSFQEKVEQECDEYVTRRLAMENEEVRSPSDTKKGSIVGVVGDLHAPFDLDAYFFHCVKTFGKYGCDRIVFIGDVIDNHFSSYHETDPDGLGGGRELDQAIERLERWYEAFPDADVITGNHDRLVSRKAHSSGIPASWIRGYSDVLGTPNWRFSERVVIDGVQYIHGEGGAARAKHKKDLMSTVQGHLHAQCYTEWTVGANVRIFGMQVGCGVDHETYAMSYARAFPKPAISCGVVFNGTQAFNVPMEL